MRKNPGKDKAKHSKLVDKLAEAMRNLSPQPVSAAVVTPAAAVKADQPRRTLIEFCTSEDSELGNQSNFGDHVEVVRLTMENDLTTQEGLEFALSQVEAAAHVGQVDLWGSLPCTAGCAWWYINLKRYASAKSILAAHCRTLEVLLRHFKIVAQKVIESGGRVHYEWPKGCIRWTDQSVQSMIADLGLRTVTFDGCTLGWEGR